MILCMDMDNTIIYSYRHEIGDKKINVELYEGREISFISEETHRLLSEARDKMQLIPVSTRTQQQYQRIDLGIGEIPCALVCNGGVLLRGGTRDEDWYRESLRLIEESRGELESALRMLERDRRRKFELRLIDDLFVFTKCSEPEQVVEELRCRLDGSRIDVFHNGEKVYAVPGKLSKGMAIRRLRERLQPDLIAAAGDSEFDVSMVEEADIGFVPAGFSKRFHPAGYIKEMPPKELFSEALLRECLLL